MDSPDRPLRRWLLIAAAVTLLGLLNFSIVITDRLSSGSAGSAKYPFLWEMTGAWTFFLLLPALLAFLWRYPVERGNVLRRVALHAAAFVAFAATHTLLMWGSRTVLYRILGWGAYRYGEMRYRFLMEGQKQLLGYLALYGIVAWVRATRRRRERELAAAALERQLTEARLAALKMQLNPHFLFNALNMISSHVYEAPETADAMITHLSDFLRSTLRHSRDQEVPLAQELDFLRSYLAIMKARFEDRLTVAIVLEPATEAARVPHLLLQPLVENSITHALDSGAGARIRIEAVRRGERLVVSVSDNGPGIPADVGLDGRRGVGLSNTSERLRFLYGDAQSIAFENRPEGGLKVEIELPFRESGAEAVPA